MTPCERHHLSPSSTVGFCCLLARVPTGRKQMEGGARSVAWSMVASEKWLGWLQRLTAAINSNLRAEEPPRRTRILGFLEASCCLPVDVRPSVFAHRCSPAQSVDIAQSGGSPQPGSSMHDSRIHHSSCLILPASCFLQENSACIGLR